MGKLPWKIYLIQVHRMNNKHRGILLNDPNQLRYTKNIPLNKNQLINITLLRFVHHDVYLYYV
jgi:hypothetical protein